MNEKLRLLQVGMGDFGMSWFRDVLPLCPGIEVAGIVSGRRAELAEKCRFPAERIYPDIKTALGETQIDAVLIVTPPKTHTTLARAALEAGVPVLCEKPAANDREDFMGIQTLSESTAVPMAIAENYRFMKSMRRCAEILASGELGSIDSICVDFFRHHPYPDDKYLSEMTDPLLMDVSVHHFDCIRYLSGQSLCTVQARSWSPAYDARANNTVATAMFELSGGCHVSYRGSLSCSENLTDWLGDWRIQCSKGLLLRTTDGITMIKDGHAVREDIADVEPESRAELLQGFAAALKSGTVPETHLAENAGSFLAVCAAIESARTGGRLMTIH